MSAVLWTPAFAGVTGDPSNPAFAPDAPRLSHLRERGCPDPSDPAFAPGALQFVTPAKAGVQRRRRDGPTSFAAPQPNLRRAAVLWTPALAGVTGDPSNPASAPDAARSLCDARSVDKCFTKTESRARLPRLRTQRLSSLPMTLGALLQGPCPPRPSTPRRAKFRKPSFFSEFRRKPLKRLKTRVKTGPFSGAERMSNGRRTRVE